MKIGIVQTKSEKGNIESNSASHKKWIEIAVSEKADLIAFPELSLTGYEPKLAKELATDPNDSRLNEFQKISDFNQITIAVGLPTKSDLGILISMVIFQPNQARSIYSKQKLHSDEKPYFIEGKEQTLLTLKDMKIAPAICYESLQPEHSEYASELGAVLYLASVAKSQTGIEKAFTHFPKIANKYSMPVLMSNCIGYCDTFKSAGQSAIWNKNGVLIGKLDDQKEGILIYDTKTTTITFNSGTKPRISL